MFFYLHDAKGGKGITYDGLTQPGSADVLGFVTLLWGAVLLQCGGSMLSPDDIHAPVPRGWNPVTLLSDKDFADIPEILRRGGPWWSGGPTASQGALEEEGVWDRDADGKMQRCWLEGEGRAASREPKRPPEAGEAEGRIVFWSLQKEPVLPAAPELQPARPAGDVSLAAL